MINWRASPFSVSRYKCLKGRAVPSALYTGSSAAAASCSGDGGSSEATIESAEVGEANVEEGASSSSLSIIKSSSRGGSVARPA